MRPHNLSFKHAHLIVMKPALLKAWDLKPGKTQRSRMSCLAFLFFINAAFLTVADPIPQTSSDSDSMSLDSLTPIDSKPILQADVNPYQTASNLDVQVDPNLADLEYLTIDSNPTLMAGSNTIKDDCGWSQTNGKLRAHSESREWCKPRLTTPNLDNVLSPVVPVSPKAGEGVSKPSGSGFPKPRVKAPDFFIPPPGLKVDVPPDDEEDEKCPDQVFPLRVCCTGETSDAYTDSPVTWFGWVDYCVKCT